MSGLSLSLRKHLREMVESELFSQHKQFIKCTNHLGEIKWLTETEIEAQHEFYPHHLTFFEKIFKREQKKGKIPRSEAIDEYLNILKEELSRDIEIRIQKDIDTRKKVRERIKSKQDVEAEKTLNDDYYKSHPDYKLYENHLGERRWLTSEEYEDQDEFNIEIVPVSKKISSALKWIIPVILLMMIAGYFVLPNLVNPISRGYLQVESNEPLGQLYIDDKLNLGLSLNEPIRLPEGSYRVSYKKAGYESSPAFHSVQINRNDTLKIYFVLTSIETEDIAHIYLQSSDPDAKVFVENNFYGLAKDNVRMVLNPGNYRIALKKENYATIPPYVDLSLNKGDSVNLSFTFTDRSVIRNRESYNEQGLIEVTSNIPDSPIYIDGKYTGFNTDYIFNKIPFGEHVVSVQKEGYLVEPENKAIRLSNSNPYQNIYFTLNKALINITIKTIPVNGKIYLNNRELGEGQWQGGLAPGKYNLHFGAVDSYHPPQPTTIEIDERKETSYLFTYVPVFSLTLSPLGLLPKSASGNIQIGYVDQDQIFHSDPNNGPEIVKSEEIGEDVWLLAYAFAYRNPPENDAIVLTFDIPSTIDLSQNLWLKMWGYRTGDKYPMEFNSISEIRISINNRMIQKDYTPRYSLEEAGESTFERFRINNLVFHGKNRLLISTGPVNTTYFALWKITIE